MTLTVLVLVSIVVGGIVGFAIFRQVQAHLELRKSLSSMEKKGNLVIDRLTTIIESLESIGATERRLRRWGAPNFSTTYNERLPATCLGCIASFS